MGAGYSIGKIALRWQFFGWRCYARLTSIADREGDSVTMLTLRWSKSKRCGLQNRDEGVTPSRGSF